MSQNGPFRIQLQSLPGLRSSSIIEAGSSAFHSRADMDCGVPLGHPEGSQGLILCRAMHVRSPLEPENQCQASCHVDHRDLWFFSRRHRAVTPAIVFGVGPRGDRRVSAGKSDVSAVQWDVGGLLKW